MLALPARAYTWCAIKLYRRALADRHCGDGSGQRDGAPRRLAMPGWLCEMCASSRGERMTGAYDLLRGLHIIAVIAWMAGLMMLPRLFAYHTETAPAGSEFDAHFTRWEGKVIKIILRPALVLVWILGLSLIYVDS